MAALLSLGAALPARAQEVVDVSDLGSLGGARVAAYGIDRTGLIVGASLDGRNEKIAFVRPPDGPMQGLLTGRNTRNAYAEARDVNARGEVLAFYAFRSSHVSYDLYLWTAARGLAPIGEHASDDPVGLDDRASVVVNGIAERTERRSAFESRRTAMILEAPAYGRLLLPELAADAKRGTRALGLSGRGDVVGYAPDATDVPRPVLWDADAHTLHVLPSALAGGPPLSGRARAINDAGTIVGELDVPSATDVDGAPCDDCTTVHVVAWRGPAHALTDLGPGSVEAINAQDVAVGDRLWDLPRGRVVTLPADGDDVLHAHDINDDGVLVGERAQRALRARYVP